MRIKKLVTILSITMALSINVAMGQAAPPAGGAGGDGLGTIVEDSLADLTLVAFAGLGGAILGLSTLSFVDEPGDHLDNIVVGGAIGIIIGVGYVAYRQAMSTNTDYQNMETGAEANLNFETSDRNKWAFDSHSKNRSKNLSHVQWTFSF